MMRFRSFLCVFSAHVVVLIYARLFPTSAAWVAVHHEKTTSSLVSLGLLSDKYLENDLVAISVDSGDDKDSNDELQSSSPRLCVVRPDGTVLGLCRHEDDVETDLFVDPRFSTTEEPDDSSVTGTYGEGWYGQRPVPSLGGGPGYGAEADEIWSIDQDVLDQIERDGVDLPILDVGIAHGEKARGGAL